MVAEASELEWRRGLLATLCERSAERKRHILKGAAQRRSHDACRSGQYLRCVGASACARSRFGRSQAAESDADRDCKSAQAAPTCSSPENPRRRAGKHLGLIVGFVARAFRGSVSAPWKLRSASEIWRSTIGLRIAPRAGSLARAERPSGAAAKDTSACELACLEQVEHRADGIETGHLEIHFLGDEFDERLAL